VKKKGQAEGPNTKRIQKQSVVSRVLLACVKRKEEGKRARGGQQRRFYTCESGGGPVYAPSLI
jgi:hypothetical protein